MPWRSFTPAHAIERVRFMIQFRQDIPSKLSKQLSDLVETVRLDARLEPLQTTSAINIAVEVSPAGKQQQLGPTRSTENGWQFARMNSQRVPLEVIAVQAGQMVYETTDYRQWATFKKRFNKIATLPVELACKSLDVELVSLEYFDRFIFDGEAVEASPQSLLVDIDRFIHADAASGRTIWHLHRGWFEQNDDGDILVNQNLDATEVTSVGQTKLVRTIGVFTKAEARSANYKIDGLSVTDLLDLLHKVTNLYFKNALTDDMLAQVGMTK